MTSNRDDQHKRFPVQVGASVELHGTARTRWIPITLVGVVVAMVVLSLYGTIRPLADHATERESRQARVALEAVTVRLDELLKRAESFVYSASEDEELGRQMKQVNAGRSIRPLRAYLNRISAFSNAEFVEVVDPSSNIVHSSPHWDKRVGRTSSEWKPLMTERLSGQTNTLIAIEGQLYAVSTRLFFHEGEPVGRIILGYEVTSERAQDWASSFTASVAFFLKNGKRIDSKNNEILSLTEVGRETTSWQQRQLAIASQILKQSDGSYVATCVVSTSLKSFIESLGNVLRSVLRILVPLAILGAILVLWLGRHLAALTENLHKAFTNLKNNHSHLEASRAELKLRVDDMQALQEVSRGLASARTFDEFRRVVEERGSSLFEGFSLICLPEGHDPSFRGHSGIAWARDVTLTSDPTRTFVALLCVGNDTLQQRHIDLLETLHAMARIAADNMHYLAESVTRNQRVFVSAAAQISDRLNSPLLTLLNAIEKTQSETKAVLANCPQEVQQSVSRLATVSDYFNASINAIRDVKDALDSFRDSMDIENESTSLIHSASEDQIDVFAWRKKGSA